MSAKRSKDKPKEESKLESAQLQRSKSTEDKEKKAGGRLAQISLDGAFGDFHSSSAPLSAVQEARLQREIEDQLLGDLKSAPSKSFALGDILPFVRDGVEDIVQDDFSRCFQSSVGTPWNWNSYLMVLWLMGCVFRYFILFPLRLASLLGGVVLAMGGLFFVKSLIKNVKLRAHYERMIIRFLCSVFVFSWTGVIKYHGTIPAKRANQIYVANHTSMIDMIVLSQMYTFSIVGQKHPGWVGFMQEYVLGCLGCVWFDRGAEKDRLMTATRIKDHVSDPSHNRLLVFPEGTCVNNNYCVQFKKGVFEMGVEICPIAIKYNKIFVDAFWNSRAQSFLMHLVSLMTSWAVVCDVYYLEPQHALKDESPIDFTARVKDLICRQAGLINVEFDGYLKHYKPSARYVAERQKVFAASLKERLGDDHEEKTESKSA